MGEFTDRVRKNQLAGPLRRAFTPDGFRQAYADSPQADDSDASTLASGLAIAEKLSAIRAALKISSSTDLSPTTKVRAFVAVANRSFFLTSEQARAAMEAFQADQMTQPTEVYALEEMAAVKIELAGGFSWLPNEIIESIVDGIQLPIGVALQGASSLSGNPKMNLIDWRDAAFEMNLGILYIHAEDIWDDCLWNDYRITEKPGFKMFVPHDFDSIRAYRIGLSRRTSLNASFSLLIAEFQKTFLANGGRLRLRDVIGLERRGKNQVVKMAGPDSVSDRMQSIFVLRGLATEPYYGELVDEPQATLGGASLSQLMDAWMIVARASQVLVDSVGKRHDARSENEAASAYMPEYVPTLHIAALIDACSLAAGISKPHATKLIEFLTYRGDSGQELWAQPLVPVGTETVSPIFAAVCYPNLRRLVDIWMRQAGIDLSRRGPAFEEHIRELVVEAINRSTLLSPVAACVPESFTFRPAGGSDEQIDLIFSIGNTVFIAEAKCILEPTDAKGVAMHRKTVLGAADQIQRKATSLSDNRAEFIADALRFNMQLGDDFRIVPLIVVSTATHVGIAAKTVPVIDEYLLGRYLDGSISDYAYFSEDPESRSELNTVFYSTAGEAEDRASSYFASPPQIERFLKGLKPRITPIFAVSEEDWAGKIVTMECVAGGKPLSLQNVEATPIDIAPSN